MDELLSLFDDNTAEEASLATGVKSDDFAPASFRNKPTKNNDDVTSNKVRSSTTSNNSLPTATNKEAAAAGKASKCHQVACDPITGLRITDRKTSRADMVDHFALLTYKSVSMLAAASRLEWAAYTTDGSDKGSTNLATCGIITSDTSSRVSSNTGRAFAMIQLGDLASAGSGVPARSNNNNIRALVTVFLFGEALSVIKRNKRFLQKGWVVSILNPSLMPSRDGSATAVSLSVNDPRQILLIGRSVDCGNCKGTIRKKVASDYGPKWEEVGCSTLIDLRGGSGYCLTHRRQGLSSRGNTNTNKASESRLQKLRADNVRNGLSHTSAFNNQRNVQSQSVAQGGRTSSSSLLDALSQPGILEETLPAASSTMTTQHLKKAPKHMKKAVNVGAAKASNPYAKSKSTERCNKRRDHDASQDDILGAALERKKARLGNLQPNSNKSSSRKSVKSKCKVFHAEGYDGSVQVPKPSSLFRKPAISAPIGSTSNSNSNEKPATSDILEKQRSLAELLQQKREGVVNSKTEDLLSRLSSRRVQQSSSSTDKSSRNNFASSFGERSTLEDRNSLLCAQSRFANAANAQEYARARGAIQELEAKEFEMDQRKQHTGSKVGGKASDTPSKATNIVTAGWVCRSCKKKTSYKPVGCIRARHDVQQQRQLKNRVSSVGSTNERLQRHGKDSEEGGLTLGSGLEWSGYRL